MTAHYLVEDGRVTPRTQAAEEAWDLLMNGNTFREITDREAYKEAVREGIEHGFFGDQEELQDLDLEG